MVRILLIFFILLPFAASSQIWDFSPAEKLPANVNTDYEEALPLLSTDGKTLFFSRLLYPENAGGKFAGGDIWSSTMNDGGAWSEAVAPKINDRGNNAVVGVNSDGSTVYLLSTSASNRPDGVYVSRRTGNDFTRPELIPIQGLEPGGFLSFFVSPDFEVIFISMRASDSRGEEDLYVTTRNTSGQWTTPKNLGSSVNTTGFEISPFLSQDKKRLYFASNGHKGFGDADIFYCDRLYNSWDTWSAPRNLGEKLNTKSFEGYFSIYGDSVAYFSSNRGGRYADIYKAGVVPGNEVLAFGQRYLSSTEISQILGANVSRRIVFDGTSTELTPAQKELIYYIATKLADFRDVNFHISVVDENNKDLRKKRLDAVARHLRESGISNVRLLLANSANKPRNPVGSSVDILLYK